MTYDAHFRHPAIALFVKLIKQPAPPRQEQALASVIRAEIDRIGFPHETDPAGNVRVHLESRQPGKPLTLVAAHMDELGLTVVGIEPDGCLRVIPSGGLTPLKTGERPLIFLGSEQPVTGILSLGSGHGINRGSPRDLPPANLSPEDLALREWNSARVITGLTPDTLRKRGVDIGTNGTIAPDMRGPVFLGDEADPLVAAWTFDDRMGCVALLRLLAVLKHESIRPQRPVTIAFTTHEEGSCHGAMYLCHSLKPEVLLAVDGCPVTEEMPLKLDGRPGIWARDRKGIYDPDLIAMLTRLGIQEGIALQRAVYGKANSDASAAYSVGAVPRIAFMGHVRENSHGFEVARLSVFDHVLTLLKRFIETWD